MFNICFYTFIVIHADPLSWMATGKPSNHTTLTYGYKYYFKMRVTLQKDISDQGKIRMIAESVRSIRYAKPRANQTAEIHEVALKFSRKKSNSLAQIKLT